MNACRIFDSSSFRSELEKGKFYSHHIHLFVSLYWDTCNIANYSLTMKMQEDTAQEEDISYSFKVNYYSKQFINVWYVLPPKLYLVAYYQVSLVNRTKIFCSDFRRPLEVLLGSACCIISNLHTLWGNCNKCYSMIVSVKDSVS